MRAKRGHWTTTDPDHLRRVCGDRGERKLRDGTWLKVAYGVVYKGPSREDVREQARAARAPVAKAA